jgi:hypothetical protein
MNFCRRATCIVCDRELREHTEEQTAACKTKYRGLMEYRGLQAIPVPPVHIIWEAALGEEIVADMLTIEVKRGDQVILNIPVQLRGLDGRLGSIGVR